MAKPVISIGGSSKDFPLASNSGTAPTPGEEKTDVVYRNTKKPCEYKNCLKWVPRAFEDTSCKCEKYFCLFHMEYLNHHCTFDWKAHALQASNPNANAVMAEKARKLNRKDAADSSG
jgi:hypothetical protein